MWLAIAVTVVASTGNNVGKALQKDATRHLPRFSLERGIVLEYARSRQWITGLAADVFGGLLMLVAFALAPVSLVQPVSCVGLVTLAIFSHLYLKERLQAAEWLSTLLAACGTVALGVASEGQASSEGGRVKTPKLSLGRAGLVLGGLFVLLAMLAVLRARPQQGLQRRASASGGGGSSNQRTVASSFGLQAGACFGMSAAACRTGFLLGSQVSVLCVPVGILAGSGLTTVGLMLQTCGLKDGNTVVVCTCAAVSSMVTGVLVGLLALQEALPSTASARSLQLLAWLLILFGVTGLALGPGGWKLLIRPLARAIPSRMLALLPTRAALQLRSAGQEKGLPIVQDASTPLRRATSFSFTAAKPNVSK
ncbi:hypothetical protein WJX74_010096 [Apatococcus lobatus]|uniref:Probable magnesium transporter n=1 Tax=Apatococcus lobatus TaxID=904363 RepID=A0AAW1RJD1_9CHLO